MGETAAYCANCGAAQGAEKPSSSAAGGTKHALDAISPHTASILCYIPVAGWIPCVWVLASDRFQKDRQTRFHAFQGLYLFVAWLILDWGIHPFLGWFPGHGLRFAFSDLLKAVIFVAWIFMLVKTSRNENIRLPLFGELADRSLSEQR